MQPLRFFCRGDSYQFWGLFEGDLHLVCPAENGQLFLLGTDRLGRDVLSRIIYGARISLTIGLIGITVSFVLGIVIGGLAGYHGGVFDLIVQRIIEVLQSIPSIPLWMALAAIMPVTWSPIVIYFGITIILGLLDWTGLARAVRSKLLALREEDYVLAAQLMGARPSRIIGRHLIPGFMSHLIATATISIPGMILGETALSFLGLGLQAADHQLGHPAHRGAERQRDRLLSLAAVPDDAGDPRHPRLQFPGRRPARRRRSLQIGLHAGQGSNRTAAWNKRRPAGQSILSAMSRLDSFIRRIGAQRNVLNAVAQRIAAIDGPVLELGLGNGRTYDHLRELHAGAAHHRVRPGLRCPPAVDARPRGPGAGRDPRDRPPPGRHRRRAAARRHRHRL